MKVTRKQILVYLLFSTATVGMAYLLTADGADLRILRAFSRSCQATARVVGTWGLESEKLYNAILERGRLV